MATPPVQQEATEAVRAPQAESNWEPLQVESWLLLVFWQSQAESLRAEAAATRARNFILIFLLQFVEDSLIINHIMDGSGAIFNEFSYYWGCLLYTSDAADE